jgi:hypothetical protein
MHQYHDADTDNKEALPWVSAICQDPLMTVVNNDEELEYAPQPLTEEQELQRALQHSKEEEDKCLGHHEAIKVSQTGIAMPL